MEDYNDDYRQLPSPNYFCWRPLRCNGQCSKLTSLQGRTCDKDTDQNVQKGFSHNHDFCNLMKNIYTISKSSYRVLLAILAACAGPVLIFEGKLGWPDVPRPAFRPWLEIMIIVITLFTF